MSQIRPNKGQVPTNSDAYNLTPDLATFSDSLNVPIRVASAAERDALPSGTKVLGQPVIRTDVPGEPLEVYNGTSWDRAPALILQANSSTVGSGMAANDFTTGTKRPFWQGGTYIGNTDGAGNIQVIYPVAFPNGVITCVGMSGDNAALGNGGSVQGSAAFTQTVSSAYFNCSTPSGPKVSATVRINWMALGW